MTDKHQKFLLCKHCGNLVGMLNDSGVKIICCGEPMVELVANTSDGATEKHLPVVKVDGNIVTVEVGSTLHPMTAEHHIAWIYIETLHGGQRQALEPTQAPIATFALAEGDRVVNVFEYCNLHGLWKTSL